MYNKAQQDFKEKEHIQMITLNLYGNKCNDYPTVNIQLNNSTVYSCTVIDNMFIDLPVYIQDGDVIKIHGIGKRHGEDGVWDTKVDSQGNILEDKFLRIDSITIFNLAMGKEWIRSINNGSDTLYDDGTIEFTIRKPFTDWLIEEKYIKQEQNTPDNLASSYRGHGRFAYAEIEKRIAAIKTLLND